MRTYIFLLFAGVIAGCDNHDDGGDHNNNDDVQGALAEGDARGAAVASQLRSQLAGMSNNDAAAQAASIVATLNTGEIQQAEFALSVLGFNTGDGSGSGGNGSGSGSGSGGNGPGAPGGGSGSGGNGPGSGSGSGGNGPGGGSGSGGNGPGGPGGSGSPGSANSDSMIFNLATEIRADHQNNNAQLQALMSNRSMSPADNPVSAMLATEAMAGLAQLQSDASAQPRSGFDFDYARLQVVMHEEAIVVLQTLRDLVRDQDFQGFLEDTRKAIAQHLSQAEDVLAAQ
jgi:predicted outer membrane protein